MTFAIEANKLGKFYKRSRIGERHSSGFWALRGLDLQIKPGERVGFIGRNGAGKSTLLKILSRITAPTEGTAKIRGRCSALLEVGTGFHPDLTGRENIFLNGTILGMRAPEVKKLFDSIVDFAEIESFLDTPIKHYSSGMQMRLAFAIAAHLESEILILDEILAVGDMRFQKKCLARMDEIAEHSSRTILFVSHNTYALSSLCARTILLEDGRKIADGQTAKIIAEYLKEDTLEAEKVWMTDACPGTSKIKLSKLSIRNERGDLQSVFRIEEPIIIEAQFAVNTKVGVPINPSFHIRTQDGVMLLCSSTMHSQQWGTYLFESGTYRMRCTIPRDLLNEGLYSLTVFLAESVVNTHVHIREVLSFRVVEGPNPVDRGGYLGHWDGLLRMKLNWSGEKLPQLV